MVSKFKKILDNLDFKNSSISEIEQLFSKTMLGHTRSTIKISPEGLFRARIITNCKEEDLQTTKSIWYPNFDEIDQKYHRLNRCSDIGQNFFYSSNDLRTVIKELDPCDGDLVMIGVFEKKFPETKIRSQYAGIEALKSNVKEHPELRNHIYISKNDKLLESYISSKFQEKIVQEEDYKYKASIAFSNILLKNKNIKCIIYPSVASDLKSVNYGIKADCIDDFFYCSMTYIFSIKKNLAEFELIPEKDGRRIIFDINNPKESIIDWRVYSELERQKTIKYSY